MAAAIHAQLRFYEAAAQVIPILLLALAVGESRVKLQTRPNPVVAICLVALFGGCMIAGELAALRVLSEGHDSDFLHGLTVASLAFGLSFLLQYLAWAAFRDVVGPEKEPSLAVVNAVTAVTFATTLATIFFLTG
ncbi:MAG TPA: hypothetical protein VGO24_05845 [Solirubrobacterales bacterium]|nr:hypothetical protein [Solirubrobacterales bacterium]